MCWKRGRDWRERPDGVLPPFRQLADEHGISVFTIHNAVKGLCERGILYRPTRSNRYRVSGALRRPSSASGAAKRIPRYRTIALDIMHAILDGVYLPGELLPPVKELIVRYNSTHKTLHAALSLLVGDGFLRRKGREYVCLDTRREERGSGGVYRAILPRASSRYNSCRHRFLMAVEHAFHVRGKGRLEVYFGDSIPVEIRSRSSAGYLYFIDRNYAEWFAFFRARRTTPLVVIDHGEFRHYPALGAHARTTVIRPDNEGAGREIGRHLSLRGHTHIAFFCHVPPWEAWSTLRLQGLRSVYNGRARELSVFGGAGVSEGCEAAEEVRSRIDSAHGSVSRLRLLPVDMLREAFDPAHRLLDAIAFAHGMQEHFEEALAQASVTAWVCDNDEIAALARAFLDRKGKPRANRIALAGFDNSPLSNRMGITSYDFSFDAMGRLAVRILLNPGDAPSDVMYTMVPGHLAARRSTQRRPA